MIPLMKMARSDTRDKASLFNYLFFEEITESSVATPDAGR